MIAASAGTPTVEMAKNIADVFDVTLIYLIRKSTLTNFDKQTLRRLKQIEKL